MIGDAPCHGKNYTGDLDDHYPDGSPEGLTVEGLMKEYCKQDIEFSMIKLNNSVDAMIQAMRQHHQELDIKDMSSQTAQKVLADHIVNMPASSSYDESADYYLGSGSGMTSGAGIKVGSSAMRSRGAPAMEMLGSAMEDCMAMDDLEMGMGMASVGCSAPDYSKAERLKVLREKKLERDGAMKKSKGMSFKHGSYGASFGAEACMDRGAKLDSLMDEAMDREFASYAIKKTGAAIKNYRARKNK